MKRLLLLAVTVMLCAAAYAENTNQAADGSSYEVVQVGIWCGIPQWTVNSHVHGVKFGFPAVSGKGLVYGYETSILYSGTARIVGVQGSLMVSSADVVEGWQYAPIVCVAAKELNGMQTSLVNVSGEIAGFQPGLINFSYKTEGMQTGMLNMSADFRGFQAGVVNIVKYCRGLQFGVVNVAEGPATQLGLINVITDGIMPFFPFINISSKRICPKRY